MTKNVLWVAVLFIALMPGCSSIRDLFPPAIPPNPPVKESRWLEQNWSPDERFWFHHVSQGTSTLPIPYSWFLALEQPELLLFKDPGLLSDPEYLKRFGFIPSPKRASSSVNPQENQLLFYGNPDGLPVGFSKTPGYPDPVTGAMLPDQIGFTCAACHTGHMEYKGTSILIDGAPAITDLGKFRTTLGLALAYTNYVPGRFGRFATRVLGEEHTPAQEKALEDALQTLLSGLERVKSVQDTVAAHEVEEGFGRLDALNRIGTQVFFTNFLRGAPQGFDPMANLVANNAPVNFPHIWDTHWFTWVQYDASIMQPMFRNAGEAFGVSARMNLVKPDHTLYKSSVPVRDLYDIEHLLAGKNPHAENPGFKGLRSPAWPEDILGSIDQARKQRGRVLYQELCQGCHLAPVTEPSFWASKLWQPPNAAGERYLRLHQIPVKHIGTDPGQAKILLERHIKVPSYLGVTGTPNENGTIIDTTFGLALATVVEKAVNLWYDEHQISPPDREKLNGYRPNHLQTALIYKARPLNGIWATPPFLHNGSVPTLYALLSPVDERPKTFCLGNREYDPKHVGYTTTCTPGTFKLDTSIPGNLNSGHEFKTCEADCKVIGRGLSREERLDLVEFLKSL